MVGFEETVRIARTQGYAEGLIEGAEYVESIGDVAGGLHLRSRATGLNAMAEVRRSRALAASGVTEIPE